MYHITCPFTWIMTKFNHTFFSRSKRTFIWYKFNPRINRLWKFNFYKSNDQIFENAKHPHKTHTIPYTYLTSDSALPFRIVEKLQASRDKAPICVVAPHSTIIDPFVIIMCYGVPVVKKSMSEIPLMGTIGKLMQIVFFDRETASQRNAALKAIKVNIK